MDPVHDWGDNKALGTTKSGGGGGGDGVEVIDPMEGVVYRA